MFVWAFVSATILVFSSEVIYAGDAVPPAAALPSSDVTQSALLTGMSPTLPDGLGVDIHFTDERPGELEMLAAAGFRWVRMDMTWAATERERGRYDFSAYDRLLQALDAHGLRALFVLGYGNKLYEPEQAVTSDAGRQAFARWSAAAAAHFKGRGILWEIWNEPNGLWNPETDVRQYVALALATAKAIREAAPGEAIIGPATSRIDLGFLEACFKAGLLDWWDAVSVHPYRQSDPESAAIEYVKLRRLIGQYAPKNKTIPILSGEWGYSAASKGFDAERQGKMLPREWLINLANQIPLSMWYDWHDDGTDPHDAEHHFGAVAYAYHAGRDPVYDPKPAYHAAKTLTTVLGGYRFAKQLTTGRPDDYALLFQHGDQLRLVLWTTAREPHSVTLSSSPGSFELVSHTGEQRRTIAVQGNSLTVTAADAPQYLLFNEPNPALANVPTTHPLWATVLPVTGTTLVVYVENLADTAFKGRARLVDVEGLEPVAAEQPLEFAAGQTEEILRFSIAAKPPRAYRFGLRIESAPGGTILDLPSRRYAPVPNELLTGCKIVADGGAQVGSELSVAVAPAPEPLPGSESPVLKVTYRLDVGWKFLRLVPQDNALAAIAGEPKAFGLCIYGNDQQTFPRLRVGDSKGQCWQLSHDDISWNGWRYVEFDLDPTTEHWGGANEDIIHFPLKWDSLFLLGKLLHHQLQGTVYVTAPVVIY